MSLPDIFKRLSRHSNILRAFCFKYDIMISTWARSGTWEQNNRTPDCIDDALHARVVAIFTRFHAENSCAAHSGASSQGVYGFSRLRQMGGECVFKFHAAYNIKNDTEKSTKKFHIKKSQKRYFLVTKRICVCSKNQDCG